MKTAQAAPLWLARAGVMLSILWLVLSKTPTNQIFWQVGATLSHYYNGNWTLIAVGVQYLILLTAVYAFSWGLVDGIWKRP